MTLPTLPLDLDEGAPVNLLAEMNRRGLKPTCDKAGNWSQVPASEIDGNDKRVLRATLTTKEPAE